MIVRARQTFPEFTKEANQAVAAYVDHVRKNICKRAPNMNEAQIEVFLREMETDVEFFALRLSKARGGDRVESTDVKKALKRIRVELYRNRRIFSIFGRQILGEIDFLRKEIEKYGKARVLDVGCSWGRATRSVVKDFRNAVETIGIDLDTFSLNYGSLVDHHISFIKADMTRMPIRSNVFDAVLCRKTLHEVKSETHKDDALSEISRVLRPNGLIYVFDPFVRFRFIKFFRQALHKILKIEEYSHTREFENAMIDNGFMITSKSCIAWPSFAPSILCSYVAIKR